MGVVDWFTSDDNIFAVVRWRQPAADAARVLADALRHDYIWPPTASGQRSAYRLGGAVTGRHVTLKVSPPTLTPVRGNLVLSGEIRDADGGSEIRIAMEIPGARSRTWILVLLALVVVLVLLPQTDTGITMEVAVAGLAVAFAAGPSIRRRNLRGRAADIEAILASIGKDADDV